RCRLADGGNAHVADEALLPQTVEAVGYAVFPQDPFYRHDPAAGPRADPVVELQQVDRRALQAGEACPEPLLDLTRYVFQVRDVEVEFGREIGLRTSLRNQPGEGLLRLSVAVLRGRIDPVDAARHGTADGLALRRVVLVNDDAADGAGAEDDLGDAD